MRTDHREQQVAETTVATMIQRTAHEPRLLEQAHQATCVAPPANANHSSSSHSAVCRIDQFRFSFYLPTARLCLADDSWSLGGWMISLLYIGSCCCSVQSSVTVSSSVVVAQSSVVIILVTFSCVSCCCVIGVIVQSLLASCSDPTQKCCC